MAERDELQKMMDEYKSNYIQYLTTGNSSYKTAYQNAQSALETMVNNKQKEVESQKADMQTFLDSYEEGNDEVSKEYDRATNLYSNAQKIDDEYSAAKNRYDLYMKKAPSTPTIDLSVGYSMILRFGIILFLIPIIFLIGYWTPQMTQSLIPNFGNRATGMPPFEFTVRSPFLSPQLPRSTL